MREAGVVLDHRGNPIHWHVPRGRTAGSLPDDRSLWDVLWEHRATIAGFAHSHPGTGVPGPSTTDVTTFRAIENGLGRSLRWWITSEDEVAIALAGHWIPDLPRQYSFIRGRDLHLDPFYTRTNWLDELRRLSYNHDAAALEHK